jgi:glycosyltransferase involved in cell wall biosynthesis
LHFAGKVAPAERDRLLSDAHVILIPSTNDNLPYAAIEAMAIGKTVLASIQGGQAEIITDGRNGFLFDHQQPRSFEKALQKVLDLDDDAIATIGNNAASFIAEELSFSTIYKKKIEIITRLLSEKQQSAIFPFARPFAKEKTLAHTHSNTLLSIVIPYYNMGEFIDECISSVLQSAHPDIEVIVVNDGSTEQSSILALQKYENDSRIRVVHKQNGGLAETRNYGASLARGEFLAFLDADDMVRNDYYSRAIQVLSRYENVFFTGSWVQYFGQKKDIWPTWNPEPPYILLHNSVNSSSLVYRKQAFLSAGLNDKKVDYGLEDYGHVISLLAAGYRGVVIPETMFCYRVRSNSMYRSLTRHKALYSHQYLSSKYSDIYKEYASDIFNLMNANGPSFAYDNPSFGMRVSSVQQSDTGIVSNLKTFVKRNPALKKLLLQARAFIKI